MIKRIATITIASAAAVVSSNEAVSPSQTRELRAEKVPKLFCLDTSRVKRKEMYVISILGCNRRNFKAAQGGGRQFYYLNVVIQVC